MFCFFCRTSLLSSALKIFLFLKTIEVIKKVFPLSMISDYPATYRKQTKNANPQTNNTCRI